MAPSAMLRVYAGTIMIYSIISSKHLSVKVQVNRENKEGIGIVILSTPSVGLNPTTRRRVALTGPGEGGAAAGRAEATPAQGSWSLWPPLPSGCYVIKAEPRKKPNWNGKARC